jgi:copper(I)-binding protein
MRLNQLATTATLLLLSAVPQWARAADLQVSAPWARPTPPGAQVGAVYFAVINRGVKEDQLQSLSTPAAASVEIHETQMVKGVMQMRPVAALVCPAGSTVKVEPGGLHVMLLGLKQPLVAGAGFDLILRFRDAGSLRVHVPVQNGT